LYLIVAEIFKELECACGVFGKDLDEDLMEFIW
jgi:hypothetical protein